MRELRLMKWCDDCVDMHDGYQSEAHTEPIIYVDGEPRRIDLCEQSDKQLLDGLRDVLAKLPTISGFSARPKPKPKAATEPAPRPAARVENTDTTDCRICGTHLKNRPSLIKHIWARHVGQKSPGMPSRCPEPGCKYTHTGAREMSAHLRSHGRDGLVAAYEAADKHMLNQVRQPELVGV